MNKRTFTFVAVVALLLFEGVASAASISTRVRVLEAKVAQQERTVKQVAEAGQAQQQQFEQGMNKVQQLENKVKGLDKKLAEQQLEAKEPGKPGMADKRYAYP